MTQKEAAATLDKWYADRPEVREWQQNSIRTAQLFGYTRTLMGRYRMLPDAMSTARSFAAKKAKGHAERASINTPIQVFKRSLQMLKTNSCNARVPLQML